MTKELTLSKSGVITPQTFAELMEYAKILAGSTLVPKDFQGKPGNIIIALQMGSEIGLSYTQALQSIGVVNGRPTIYGDGAAGLVRSKGKPSLFKEYEIGERGDSDWRKWNNEYGYACEIERRGSGEITRRTFTIADAKRADLWEKPGPWTKYPQRMLMMRARSWAMRDSHADVLRGLSIYEEAIDIEATPEPDKATISIEDFRPKEEQEGEMTLPEDDPAKVEYDNPNTDTNIKSQSEKPKVPLAELQQRIGKACMYLSDNNKEGAELVYHGFADIVNPITKTDENGDSYTEMNKIIAKDLKEISIEQARTVWGKIKKHFKEKGWDIKEKLKID